ncbi:MAG: helix-turn-helix transcriptional regulator [Pseudonocardiales bacterium]
MSTEDPLTTGQAALAAGCWGAARTAFEAALAEEEVTREETAQACFGLAAALWWLGENQESVSRCAQAYALFRRTGEVGSAVQCAVWLSITYKANFANFAAANGWLERAQRLLEPLEPGPLHGWTWVARAYRMADLDTAEELTARAADLARQADDTDLELVALSQLGLIRVGQGQLGAGFALIDEAMAAALAGERSTLDTVVYTCCDMLNACELASDVKRAAQWCKVADDFVERYGCPFLYAECRIYYGSVLAAKGRWDDAERELGVGLRITDGACPGLHAKALTRLATLRIRQGRLEEAEQHLSQLGAATLTIGMGGAAALAMGAVEAEAEETLSLAALLLARGDAPAASRNLTQRLDRLAEHRMHLAAALDLLVDAYIAAGNGDAATTAARRLADVAAAVDSDRLDAVAAGAQGRVSIVRGDPKAAVTHLETALRLWSHLEFPFEVARTRFDLGRVLAPQRPDVGVDHARRALDAFEALGARLDADRVAAFLRSLGVNARTGPKGVGTLTMREQEVLRLLGTGLSNPEIAARLHVTRKTASHHVSNILTKLHLRNRAEATAYAVGVLGAAGNPSSRRP